LVKENEIIIDRPKGTKHPRYNDIIYEFDYGYINNTKTTDGNGMTAYINNNDIKKQNVIRTHFKRSNSTISL
jgi:inorganic pyrophosphatase